MSHAMTITIRGMLATLAPEARMTVLRELSEAPSRDETRERIEQAIAATRTLAEAAGLLKMHRKTLARAMKGLEMKPARRGRPRRLPVPPAT